jgi:hypothetical protein
MTPKEKAEELVKKMYHLDNRAWYETCKQCAIIAVDEILNLPFEFEIERKYFEQVKQELEKL